MSDDGVTPPPPPASPAPQSARNVVTEFVATAILMLTGPGVLILADGVSTLGVAVSFGVGLAVAIGVIGAVANPALSLALLLVREISMREAIGDWVGQVLGAVAGAAMIWGVNDQTRAVAGANGWDRNGFAELGTVFAAELVFAIVVAVVFLSAISQGLSKAAIAAFTAASYAVAHLVLLDLDGGGVNPARSIGSALFADTDPNALGQVWLFVVAPLVGAVAAVFVWLAVDEATVDDTIFDETVLDDLADAIDGQPD